jgi:hypothetical protein
MIRPALVLPLPSDAERRSELRMSEQAPPSWSPGAAIDAQLAAAAATGGKPSYRVHERRPTPPPSPSSRSRVFRIVFRVFRPALWRLRTFLSESVFQSAEDTRKFVSSETASLRIRIDALETQVISNIAISTTTANDLRERLDVLSATIVEQSDQILRLSLAVESAILSPRSE